MAFQTLVQKVSRNVGQAASTITPVAPEDCPGKTPLIEKVLRTVGQPPQSVPTPSTGPGPTDTSFPPLTPLSSACPVGSVTELVAGLPFSVTLTATGGIPPYIWSVTSGALPTGLTLNPSTGEISGTLSANGTFTYTIGLQSSDGQNITVGPCQLVVSLSMIARPTYIEEYEDEPPVNPLRSRINDGVLVGDADEDTYAEMQFDSSGSLVSDYANLQMSDFLPVNPLPVTSVVVHIITQYIAGTIGGLPAGPQLVSSDIFNVRNVSVVNSDSENGNIANLQHLNGGAGSVAKAEYTHTISALDWATYFSSDVANVWVRCKQSDTQNFTLDTTSKYRIYECWLEYFF